MLEDQLATLKKCGYSSFLSVANQHIFGSVGHTPNSPKTSNSVTQSLEDEILYNPYPTQQPMFTAAISKDTM